MVAAGQRVLVERYAPGVPVLFEEGTGVDLVAGAPHDGEGGTGHRLVVPGGGGGEGERGLDVDARGPRGAVVVRDLLHDSAAAHGMAEESDAAHVEPAAEAARDRGPGVRGGQGLAQGSVARAAEALPEPQMLLDQGGARLVDGVGLPAGRGVDAVGADRDDHEALGGEGAAEVVVALAAGDLLDAGSAGPGPELLRGLLDQRVLACFLGLVAALPRLVTCLLRAGAVGGGRGVGARLPRAVLHEDDGVPALAEVRRVVDGGRQLAAALVAERGRGVERLVAEVVAGFAHRAAGG